MFARADLLGRALSPFRLGGVAMFHTGRSGSVVLGDLLNQHPRVFWDAEILIRLVVQWRREHASGDLVIPVDPIAFLRRRMRLAGTGFYLFEVKPYHLQFFDVGMETFVEHLADIGVTHFIILERRNYLRKIVSSLVAQSATGSYSVAAGAQPVLNRVVLNVEKVAIDLGVSPKPLLAYLSEYGNQFAKLRRILRDEVVLDMTYEEDLLRDVTNGYRSVIRFLRLKEHPVAPRYGRANPFQLSEMIVNFEEVQETLVGTAFEWMLYE